VTSRSLDAGSGHLLRELAPQVLGAVIRRFRDFAVPANRVRLRFVKAAACTALSEFGLLWEAERRR
jgi:hypothetical protein